MKLKNVTDSIRTLMARIRQLRGIIGVLLKCAETLNVVADQGERTLDRLERIWVTGDAPAIDEPNAKE